MTVSRGMRFAVILFLLTAGAAGFYWRGSRPVAAKVVRPIQREVVEWVVASGTLRAVRQAAAGFEVPGLVEQVLAREGDWVTNGQVLATLRMGDLLKQSNQVYSGMEVAREELTRTRVARLDAETNYARAESLFLKRINATADLDAARTSRDTARAAESTAAARLRESEALLEVTAQQLRKRHLEAAFDGLVIRRQVEPGDGVTIGEPLLTLAETARTEIYVETDENNLGRLRLGQPATVVAPAYPASPFRAELTQIGPGVDAARGVVGVRLKPGALPGWVLPNMTVDVNIEVGRHTNALAVPASSLLEENGRILAMVVRDGRVAAQPVKLLGRNTHWAAVAEIDAGADVLLQATAFAAGRRVRATPAAIDMSP